MVQDILGNVEGKFLHIPGVVFPDVREFDILLQLIERTIKNASQGWGVGNPSIRPKVDAFTIFD